MNQLNNVASPHVLDNESLPLCGSRLIEASAGTGKTYTIAMLYLRLILGHDNSDFSLLRDDLTPRDILVVTFTEAATKELSDRIRRRLSQALDVFDENYEGEDFGDHADLVNFRDAQYPDKRTWSQCQKKLILALELMDEAAISTIHSWCYRMLREHAFDSGSLFEQNLIPNENELFDQAIRDYWRIFVYPLNSQEMALLQYHFPNIESLLPHIKYTYKHAQHIESEWRSLHDLPIDLFSNIKTLHHLNWEHIISESQAFFAKVKVKDITASFHHATLKSMVTAIEKLPAWLESGALFPDKFGNSPLQKLTLEQFTKFVDEVHVNQIELVSVISQLNEYYKLLQAVQLSIVAHASKWVFERVQAFKQQTSELGFDELIKSLHKALENDHDGHLQQTITNQFPAVLIDEFQDTDNVQYEIFDKLYKLSDNDLSKCLLLIGDPKQAIYSFRGGDIYTYLTARKAVDERRYTLKTNYRSSHQLVDAVNHIFNHADNIKKAGAFAIVDNSDAKQQKPLLPFESVKAKGLKDYFEVEGEEQPALTLYLDDEKRGADKVAASVASKIVSLLNASKCGDAGFKSKDSKNSALKGLRASDIAVLVNSRNEAARIKNALGERQLKSYYVSDKGSILHTIEASEILIWLKAVAHPKQISNIRAALACSLVGKSFVDLYQNIDDDLELDNLFEEFLALHQLWQSQGVYPMLRTFLHRFKVADTLLHKDKKQERVLTNILHIAELLQEASIQIDGINNLVSHYEDLLSSSDQDKEFLLPRLESEKGLVQIVTFHKSKGLQYPIVFIPYGTTPPRPVNTSGLVRFHNEHFEAVNCLGPSDEQIRIAEDEILAERIRTLYVALTRAQFATYVGLTKENSWYKSAIAYLIDASKADCISEKVESAVSACANIALSEFPDDNTETFIGDDTHHTSPAREMSRKVAEEWRFHSYSSIEYQHSSHHSQAPVTQEVVDSDVASIDKEQRHFFEQDIDNSQQDLNVDAPETLSIYNFYKGANAGTFLHNILEWCCLQGFNNIQADRQLLATYISQQTELQAWSHYDDILNDWIFKLIDQPIPLSTESRAIGDSESQTSLIELHTAIAEMEFLFEANDASLLAIDELISHKCHQSLPRPSVKHQQLNGMFKGFIDLTFEFEGKYYVLDYKSNYLGDSAADYDDESMLQSILSHRYDLQYVIYLLALHRMLKNKVPNYSYEEHIGGAVYYFLRGVESLNKGIFTAKPPFSLIQSVDNILLGQDAGKQLIEPAT